LLLTWSAAAIRYELGRDHTYEFFEGVIVHDQAPGGCGPIFLLMQADIVQGTENLATSGDACFAYYDFHCSQSFKKAITDLERVLATEGPFDGILAFSQGTSLASAFLLDEPKLRKSRLKCAIFFCGRTPFQDLDTASLSSCVTLCPTIDLPTAHIWGANDKVDPGQGRALSELCRLENKHCYIHAGEHEIPGSSNQEWVVESANAIRRMLFSL
jgi:hypothetical protein